MTASASILVLLIVVCSVLVLGRTIMEWARVETESPLAANLHAGAIGTMALVFSVAALGACGALFPLSICLWIAAALLLGRRWVLRAAGGLREAAANLGRQPPAYLALLALGLSLVILAVIAAFREPASWDEVAYTLFLPKEYVRRNGFPYIQEYGPYSAFPFYQEMLSVAGLLLGFEHVLPHLFNTCAYAMVGLSAALLAVRIGVRGVLAPATFVLVAAMPASFELAAVTKNDLLLCAYELLALDMLFEWRRRDGLRRIVLAGAYCGFAIGIKYTAVPVIALFGLILIAFAWQGRATAARWYAPVAAFAGVALVACSPWALRNLFTTGNPFFPLLTGLFGGGGTYRFLPLHARIMHQMTYGLVDFSMASSSAGLSPLLRRIVSGVGLVPYLCLPVAFALEWRRARKGRPPEGLSSSWTVLFLAATILPIWMLFLFWEPRYVLFLQVILVVLVALCLQRIELTAAAKAVVTCAALLACAAPGVEFILKTGPWRVQSTSRRPLVERREAFIWLAGAINDHVAKGARVATNAQPFYYLDRPIVHLHPMSEYGHFQLIRTPDELLERFRELRVDYVAYGDEIVPPSNYTADAVDVIAYLRNMRRLIHEAGTRGGLRLLWTFGGIQFFAVEHEPASASR